MIKTGAQVQTDFYHFVKKSPLASMVSGMVYKAPLRPHNAVSEDITVRFLTGTHGQIQNGVMIVNVFVPNIEANVPDLGRLETLEGAAAEWLDGLQDFDGYSVRPDDMIKSMPYEDGKQYFVNIRLRFDYTTF